MIKKILIIISLVVYFLLFFYFVTNDRKAQIEILAENDFFNEESPSPTYAEDDQLGEFPQDVTEDIVVEEEEVEELVVPEEEVVEELVVPEEEVEELVIPGEDDGLVVEGGEESEVIKNEKLILYKVPFASQSPFGDWSDMRQQDGCEEASVLMAMLWLQNKESISKEDALKAILAISEFELVEYGSYMDTSASSTVERILEGYYDFQKSRLQYDITEGDIIAELEAGNLVIAPFNGKRLGNIYYTAPGPERHMLIIVGYDYVTQEFITNDPGTRHGEGYRYDRDVLFNAVRDYQTGEGLPVVGERKAMIVIGK